MEDRKERILFISSFDEEKKFSGINKKIYNQYLSIKNNKNRKIYLSYINEYRENIHVGVLKTQEKKVFKNKIEMFLHRWSFYNKFIIKENIDILYIRYEHFSSPNFIKFLKDNKNLKIILEIPTFPYDSEYKKSSYISKIKLSMDKIFRTRLYKYVDRIVTFSSDKKIWKIPCINISNGIKLEEISVIKNKKEENQKIIFTSVSSCDFWHGIDRFLYSLQKYGELKNKKEINFNIIGNGPEIDNLKNIVFKSNYLSQIVKFNGFKTGKELERIYDETNIGVGSLGRHRSGVYTMKALKNREYCAKGLPMIFSEDDPDLRSIPFIYQAKPTEDLIDIDEVIRWYEEIKLNSDDIREYAHRFSWDIQMKKVLDEIDLIDKK